LGLLERTNPNHNPGCLVWSDEIGRIWVCETRFLLLACEWSAINILFWCCVVARMDFDMKHIKLEHRTDWCESHGLNVNLLKT
jgi:hypothetical protein